VGLRKGFSRLRKLLCRIMEQSIWYDQCNRQNTAFFMKRLGGHPNKRENIEYFPLELQIREFPTMTVVPNEKQSSVMNA
jgi:protein gp37